MKLRFLNKLNPRLIIAFAILLIAFIIHSCKKDNSNNKQQPDVLNTTIVNMAKQWYTTTYSPANSTGKRAIQSIGDAPNAWNQTLCRIGIKPMLTLLTVYRILSFPH